MDIKEISGYSADSIKELKGATKHRHHVSRFLGSSSILGIENQLFEIIDNSLDEIIAYSDRLTENNINIPLKMTITINEDDSVIIEDNGRGIPCDKNSDGIPAIYPACEEDSAGGKNRGTAGYEGSGHAGTHGAGLAVSKSCTDYFRLIVNSISGNGVFALEYIKGERNGELKRIGNLEKYPNEPPYNGFIKSGTQIHYKYDETLFRKTLDGIEVEEPYDFERIDARLSKMLVGQTANVQIIFNYKGKTTKVYDPKEYSPMKLLGVPEDKIIELEVEDKACETPYKGKFFITYTNSIYDAGMKAIVNRLEMEQATVNSAVLVSLAKVFNQAQSAAYYNKQIEGSFDIDYKTMSKYIKGMVVFSLANAEYAGQTKEKLTSERYLSSFYTRMEQSIKEKYEQVASLIFSPMHDALVVDKKRAQEIEKARKKREEYEKKIKEQEKSFKQSQKELNDPIAYEKRRQESDIEIQTAPAKFYNKDVTLVYVEGKSAATELKDLHKVAGPQPYAIAALEGKITNLYKDGDIYRKSALDKISRDNMNFCLNAGYKDIAIFTDADEDGIHIRLLIIAQILRLKPTYLTKGKVFIIPTPYSRIYINKRTTLDVLGDIKIYEEGEYLTFNSKEHEALKSLPNVVVKEVFRGLADTTISTNKLLLDRENWIPVDPPTEKDIIVLQKILKKRDVFKSSYTSNLYTSREYNSKFLKILSKYTELNRKDMGDIELDYMDEPNLLNTVAGGGVILE